MRLQASATIEPALQAAAAESVLIARNPLASAAIAPARSIASTITNKPATSGSTPQEMSRTMGHGFCRDTAVTLSAVTAPAMKVGRPSGRSRAEQAISTMPVQRMPQAVRRPGRPSTGRTADEAMRSARKARRCVSQSVK